MVAPDPAKPPPSPPQHLSDQTRGHWLRLIRSENVGPRLFRELINRFGGASEALAALPELSRRGGRKRSISICSPDDANREIEAINKCGARLVALGEADYPPLLRQISDPPPLLTIKGKGEVLTAPAIAMVGARNASALGRKIAARLSTDLGREGHVIVSGLARGIDGVAHEAALKTGTIAVVAGGIDVTYPPEHQTLMDTIAERGCLISEVAIGTRPTRHHFPRRNRLVSGIAAGTIIIDAAARSGSLITARFALEQNREVFAVPGSPLDPRAEGGNSLIRNGAILVRHADDVLAGLNPMVRTLTPPHQEGFAFEHSTDSDQGSRSRPQPFSDDKIRDNILELLSVTPTEIDELIRASEASAQEVVGVLQELEIAGRLIRHSGQKVSLSP